MKQNKYETIRRNKRLISLAVVFVFFSVCTGTAYAVSDESALELAVANSLVPSETTSLETQAEQSSETANRVITENAEEANAQKTELNDRLSEETADNGTLIENSDASIPINEANFPDPAFRDYVSKNFDTSHDGTLSEAERYGVTRISVAGQGITNMTGIALFPELDYLYCDRNNIAELDTSGNLKLTYLSCSSNPLHTLNISQNSKLQTLEVWDASRLQSLDVSHCPELEAFSFGSMPMSYIDLSANTNLTYLNYYGGSLEYLDLSHNPRLQQLICSASLIHTLDLSHNPELISLGLNGGLLSTLNLEDNANINDVDARDNQLVSIHGNVSTAQRTVASNLSGQKTRIIGLSEGSTSFDMSRIDPLFADGTILNLEGAALNGSVLSDLTVGTPVRYTYQSDGFSLEASLEVTNGNLWTQPLTMDGWTYGATPNLPQAQAKYGTVHYLYGHNGNFTANLPSQAGEYTVKAVVDGTGQYSDMQAETNFTILRATPDVVIPSSLTAIYGDRLSMVLLPAGYTWNTPDAFVGAAGQHTFYATYTPEDTTNYLTLDALAIPLTVEPKDGSGFDTSPITNEEQAQNVIVRDGDIILVSGTDYTVTQTKNGDTVIVTIQFMGNYKGQIIKQYTVIGQSGGTDNPTNNGTSASGTAVKTDDSAPSLWKPVLLICISVGAIIAAALYQRYKGQQIKF